MSQDSELVPGPTPSGETILPPDTKFVEKCRAVFADDVRDYGWQFGRSVLSRSKRWGLVWRADVTSPRSYPARVVVWWPDPDGESYGRGHIAVAESPLPTDN